MNETLKINNSMKDKAIIRRTREIADLDLEIVKLERKLKSLIRKRDDVVYPLCTHSRNR